MFKSAPVLLVPMACVLVGCGMRAAPEAPPLAASEPDFCIGFQQQLSRVPLQIDNQVYYDDWEGFVLSKPTMEPLVTHQMAFAGHAGGMAEVVSCKLKGEDHLAEIHGEHNVVTGLTCADFNRQIIEQQAAELRAEGHELAVDPASLVYAEDERATRGTQWLGSMPYPVLSRLDDGTIQVQGKVIRSALRSWTPIPRSWKGMFYCHLVAPEYARALLAGEVTLAAD